MSLRHRIGSERGATAFEYLLFTTGAVLVAIPILNKFGGEKFLGGLRQNRQQMVSFIAQERKQSVPTAWFSEGGSSPDKPPKQPQPPTSPPTSPPVANNPPPNVPPGGGGGPDGGGPGSKPPFPPGGPSGGGGDNPGLPRYAGPFDSFKDAGGGGGAGKNEEFGGSGSGGRNGSQGGGAADSDSEYSDASRRRQSASDPTLGPGGASRGDTGVQIRRGDAGRRNGLDEDGSGRGKPFSWWFLLRWLILILIILFLIYLFIAQSQRRGGN